MKLPDKAYNFLKWLCLIAVPALITLITTLGTVYKQDMTTVTATISAIATFVGALIGISNYSYNKANSDTSNDSESGTDA